MTWRCPAQKRFGLQRWRGCKHARPVAPPRPPRGRRPPRQRSRPRPSLRPPRWGQGSHRLPPRPPVVRDRSWRPSRPRGRMGFGLPRCARPPAFPRGRSPVRSMACCSGGRSAQGTTALWRRGRRARRGSEVPRRVGAGARASDRLGSARIPRRQGLSPRLLSPLGGVRPEMRRGDECGAQAAGRPGTYPSPALCLRAPPRAPAPSPQSGRALCGPAPAAPGHAAHWRPSPGGGRWPGAPRQAGAPASPRP